MSSLTWDQRNASNYFMYDLFISVLGASLLLYPSITQEGAGPRVMSAFVEIVFDNSDNRIPVGVKNL